MGIRLPTNNVLTCCLSDAPPFTAGSTLFTLSPLGSPAPLADEPAVPDGEPATDGVTVQGGPEASPIMHDVLDLTVDDAPFGLPTGLTARTPSPKPKAEGDDSLESSPDVLRSMSNPYYSMRYIDF